MTDTIHPTTEPATAHEGHCTRIRALIHNGGIPEHMHQSIESYVLNGLPGGGFQSALFANDFIGACARADDLNLHALQAYAKLMHNLPIGCSGSAQAVQSWCAIGGLRGVYAASAT